MAETKAADTEAIVLAEAGGPEVLRLETVALANPGPGHRHMRLPSRR